MSFCRDRRAKGLSIVAHMDSTGNFTFGKVASGWVIDKTSNNLDKSNWVFLSVTPSVGEKIIKDLKFKKNQKVISFISTITLSELKKMIKEKVDIVRAIPLPPISLKEGPVPICPPNKKVKAFFDKLGSTVEIKNCKNKSRNY